MHDSRWIRNAQAQSYKETNDGRTSVTRCRPAALLPGLLLWMQATSLPAADSAVPANVRAMHERMLVLDSHLDTPMLFDEPLWNILERHEPGDGTNQVDLPRMIDGGLDGGLWVIYTRQGERTLAGNRAARDHGLKRLLQLHRLVAAHPEKFE